MKVLFRNYIPKVYEELQQLFTIEEWKSKRIILFGMNMPAKIEQQFFTSHQIPISAIVDNGTDKQGLLSDGIKVTAPKDTLAKVTDNTIIIIASGAHAAMEEQCLRMGWSSESIYKLKSFFYRPEDIEPFPVPEGYSAEALSLQDIQAVCLEMLQYVAEFCDKRNIRYFLSDGTLLGAVRHKGFIPWDDDVDISMPYKDYLRFCEEFQNTDSYVLNSMFCKEAYDIPCNSSITRIMNTRVLAERAYFPIYSRQGICIDIFPMNGYPDTEAERKAYENELSEMGLEWSRCVRHRLDTKDYTREEHKRVWEKMTKLMERYDYDTSAWVGGVHCTSFNHSIAPRERYERAAEGIFEGGTFKIPNDADYILTQAYGDYMKLPPENQRTPKHFLNTYRLGK